MSRTVGANGARTAKAINAAGLQLIYEHGYEAMSLRQLATMVGLRAASLYNYMTTKQDLLFRIILAHMQDLIERGRQALEQSDGTAPDRLRIFIAHHVRYHIKKKREVYVANFELRALTQPNYATIVAMRVEYERLLIAILDDGVRNGSLVAPDTRVSAYALLAMLTGACTWYKSDGRLGETQLVDMYTALAFNGFSVPDAGAGSAAGPVTGAATRRRDLASDGRGKILRRSS